MITPFLSSGTAFPFCFHPHTPIIAHRRPLKIHATPTDDDGWEDWAEAPSVPQLSDYDWQATFLSSLEDAQTGGNPSSPKGPDSKYYVFDNGPEKALLVGVQLKSGGNSRHTISASLEELGRLAESAGLEVVGSISQMLETPNPRTYIGSGKLNEIARAVEAMEAETIIFDDELSPSQLRNLEKVTGGQVRLCDRTALVLDVFSQRAATREGQLQVELAQVEYQIPRLTRMWTHLERQSGSGQMKGMGEKQIEVDRRLLRGRAARLRRDIEDVRKHRKAYRERRASAPLPVIALVGYTNAGKSSLLNALTDAGVLAEDKLFATLDPTTRRMQLGGGTECLITDTVGFIQKLPTQLVAAFRATLEEITEASLLLHIVDASSPAAAAQVDAVNKVLKEIIGDKQDSFPQLTVWNKVDACAEPGAIKAVAAARPGTICISALTGDGLAELEQAISSKLQEQMVEISCLVPYNRGDIVEEIHRTGAVIAIQHTEAGTRFNAKVPLALAARLRELRAMVGKQEEAPVENPLV